MKVYLIFLFLLITISSFAQFELDSVEVNGSHKLPEFKIGLIPDTSVFSNTDLDNNRPVIIIGFTTDYEPVNKLIKELLTFQNDIKDIQVIMISYYPFQTVKTYWSNYNLASLPSVKVACGLKDGFWRSTYEFNNINIRMPIISVYAKGKLRKIYSGYTSLKNLLRELQEKG